MYKRITIILSLSLTISMMGCQDEQAVLKGKVKGYNELVDRVDSIIVNIGADIEKLPLAKEFAQADPATRAEMALYLAEDMAVARMFDLTTEEVLILAGNAVKAYPHPLLLNNYAAMVLGEGYVDEALYLSLKALHTQPDNPILLTNIANLYIELDDFAAAELYASKALQAAGDFGPAYQVMTTIHLRNGNNELAAETMVKSARHVFNDVTVHHFDSFLESVEGLDPGADEYPLNEAFVDVLYEIARKNVDTGDVNDSVDTPEGQIRIKPFPTLGSPEHLERSENYLLEEIDKAENADNEALGEQIDHDSRSNSSDSWIEGVYPIEYNIRQVYAYKILESYYAFKLGKAKAHYHHKEEQMNSSRRDRVDIIDEAYESKAEAHDKKDPGNSIEAIRKHLFVALQIQVDWKKERYIALKQDASVILSESQNLYNEVKQILEEFWLKSGGILKYIVDKDQYYSLHASRKRVVYSNMIVQYRNLYHLSVDLGLKKLDLKMEENALKLLSGDGSGFPEEEEEPGEDLLPEMKDGRELDVFPEPGTMHNLQIGLEHGFFGNDASVTGNSRSYEAAIDTLVGARGWDGSFATGIHRSYTLHGVKAIGNTAWFSDTKAVQEALVEGVGKGAGILGKIGIGFIDNEREGKYMTQRAHNNKIMDRGKIHVKESGWSLGPVERVEKTERTVSSTMIGFAETKNSIKYKFAFVSVSWEQR